MRHPFLFAVVVGALGGGVSAQQIWNVHCNGGPGVHFTDLPPAVAAASPGDEIRVYRDLAQVSCPIPNFAYTAPIIDKPLRIVGFTVGLVGGQNGVNLRGGMLIVGLGPGEEVVLTGGRDLVDGADAVRRGLAVRRDTMISSPARAEQARARPGRSLARPVSSGAGLPATSAPRGPSSAPAARRAPAAP